MESTELVQIADVLLASPGWARVGLTAPDTRMRRMAATELAQSIHDRLHPPLWQDRDQLPLPL